MGENIRKGREKRKGGKEMERKELREKGQVRERELHEPQPKSHQITHHQFCLNHTVCINPGRPYFIKFFWTVSTVNVS